MSSSSSSSLATSSRRWPNRNMQFVASLLAIGSSFSFGFQMMWVNPAREALMEFVRATIDQEEAYEEYATFLFDTAMAIFFAGSILGGFVIQPAAEHLGRRRAYMVGVITYIVSCAITILAKEYVSYTMFTTSRFVSGFGIAISMGLSAIITIECSSAETRGVASLVNGLFLQVALVVTSVLAMPFLLGSTCLWEILFWFQILLNVIVLIVVLYIPETPTYLASHKTDDEKKLEEDVTESLVFFREMDEDDARLEARRIIDSYHCSQNKKPNLVTLWKCKFSARGTLIGMLIMGAMAQSGITIINFYAVRILTSTGLNTNNASIANSFLCLFAIAGIVTAFFIVDKYGRKKLILVTFIALIVINIGIVGLLFLCSNFPHTVFNCMLIGAICLFNFFFSMGPGPLSMFIAGELVPQQTRSAASIYTSVTMAMSRFLTLVFYTRFQKMTSEAIAFGLFFLPPMIIVVVILHRYLPETKGTTVEQLQAEFNASSQRENTDEIEMLDVQN
ncbi:Protein CBG08888 [Caenorhabditis briggsae]|uniref:Protein CBG08888 n=2 Tax=Caenorhabditis briggsae TaxID=6238 RepID=A8X7M2_CAEBR|nr:Protein CBG08888 [Caenorhabditis briggsae]ULT85263.1 hypothetical protein L3Y34_013801 [Caenorhabditis briggsae]CAP28633.1 Protein CBG08888 [Caenorhabditis briggsae]